MSDLDENLKTNFQHKKHRLLANIVFTSNWIQNNMSDALIPFGISSQQFNILRILRGAGDWMVMNEVKKRMVDKSPHTTRLTTKLLDKGLIERRRGEKDRRVVYVGISKAGLDLLSEIDIGLPAHVDYLENISGDEADLMNSMLDKLRS